MYTPMELLDSASHMFTCPAIATIYPELLLNVLLVMRIGNVHQTMMIPRKGSTLVL